MIIVRWCIPDMSPQLRNRIRREIYITNEIIIQHEAQRACGQSCDHPDSGAQLLPGQESKTDHWNRVLRDSISTFDFDLEVHGDSGDHISTEETSNV